MIKGIDVIKKELEHRVLELSKIERLGENDSEVHPDDVLFEVELEDMCEQDPSVWESIATQWWHEYEQAPGVRVPAAMSPGSRIATSAVVS